MYQPKPPKEPPIQFSCHPEQPDSDWLPLITLHQPDRQAPHNSIPETRPVAYPLRPVAYPLTRPLMLSLDLRTR